ncbi:Replication protein P [Serratia entomophila]|uniref:replication protein P n=1 Tax=Serratia entomophila TaxID=42906 RepID=UPI001EED3A21|nr:replication protein P [Serratia entomophila]UIW19293.1 DNA replication protein [Serratia entomophila]UIW19477.1 DNA replication protein [Serratia entomophila]CAI0819779.1 Replication protein P [Serratia entomophila]CAI0822799.1 Replication protein P [Serratia entomophila]CAI0843442.1 Replication protein P [Serratia entomophila]
MTKKLMTAIASRDGATLAKLYGSSPAPVQSIVNPEAEKLVDALFRQLKQVFPAASQTNLRSEADESAAKKQWIAAFAENGIRSREQLSAGMQHARASESPFWPSPGQFIAWCKQGVIRASGLPDDSELYEMVMVYSAKRGLYDTPEAYPWKSNACYWMVTKLYSEMRGLNLAEAELRKRCSKELSAMSKRIEADEPIPAPVVQIPKLHTPVSQEKALDKIAEIRAKLNLPRRG